MDEPPPSLWSKLRHDPLHAPEHVALAAAEFHAPAAAKWVERERRVHGYTTKRLVRLARKRHLQLASIEGAATGVGGFLTLVPDLVGLAWIQSRLVFFIAAAHGLDPHDPMRPAELLMLNGLYPTREEARAALDGAGRSVAEAYIGTRLSREETIVMRLLRMVGKRGTNRLGGRLVPGFAVAFNALANRRDTSALAKRAIRYYGNVRNPA